MNVTSRTAALYGGTGTGKTEQLIQFVRHIYETTGKKTRWIGADNGDWQARIQPYVDAGVVDAVNLLDFMARKDSAGKPVSLFAVTWKLAKGDWPGVENGRLKFTPATPITWSEVGAYAIDSGTGLAANLEQELQLSPAMQSGKEQTFKYGARIEGDTEDAIVSGGSWDHIRATQNSLRRWIIAFGNLPVHRTIWTFGEDSGKERATGKPEYGPAVTGRAAIASLPADIGDLLHCEVYSMVDQKVDDLTGKPNPAQSRFRIYFLPHPEPMTGILYPAKCRVPAIAQPALLNKYPGGYFAPTVDSSAKAITDSLADFLKFEDRLIAAVGQTVGPWKEAIDAARKGPTT